MPKLSVPAATTAAAPTGTVGRQPVFDEAVTLLEEASSTGSMRFLLVAGEPGIGKSRLVTDLGDRASAAGFRVLVGRCHEGDYAPALWPWLGIVRSLAGQPGASQRLSGPTARPTPRWRADRRSQWRWHRSADVRRRRRAGAALRRRDAAVAGAGGPALGRRHVAAAAQPPGRIRTPGTGRGDLHPAYDGGHHRAGSGRHDGCARAGRGRADPAGRSRHRRRGRAAAGLGRGARRPAGRGGCRADRGQPVLRPAVRPAARGDPRPAHCDGGGPPRARWHPRRPAAAPLPAAGGGGDGADRGRCTRSPDRPGPGLGARRAPGRPLPRPAGPRDDQWSGRGAGRGVRLRARAGARDDVRRAQRGSQDAAARPRGTGDRAASCRQRRRERRDRASRPPRCAARSRARRTRA